MQDQDIINEDERHEAATETPIGEVKDEGEGEQRNVPLAHFPSGADGTEPAPEKLAEFCQSELQREEARRLRKIVWRAYVTKVDLAVMGKTRQNGKVYEVRVAKRQADVSDTYAQLKVNGKTVLTGSFTGSAWMAKRMMTAAAQALVNHKAKRNRDSRRNHKKRRRQRYLHRLAMISAIGRDADLSRMAFKRTNRNGRTSVRPSSKWRRGWVLPPQSATSRKSTSSGSSAMRLIARRGLRFSRTRLPTGTPSPRRNWLRRSIGRIRRLMRTFFGTLRRFFGVTAPTTRRRSF